MNCPHNVVDSATVVDGDYCRNSVDTPVCGPHSETPCSAAILHRHAGRSFSFGRTLSRVTAINHWLDSAAFEGTSGAAAPVTNPPTGPLHWAGRTLLDNLSPR